MKLLIHAALVAIFLHVGAGFAEEPKTEKDGEVNPLTGQPTSLSKVLMQTQIDTAMAVGAEQRLRRQTAANKLEEAVRQGVAIRSGAVQGTQPNIFVPADSGRAALTQPAQRAAPKSAVAPRGGAGTGAPAPQGVAGATPRQGIPDVVPMAPVRPLVVGIWQSGTQWRALVDLNGASQNVVVGTTVGTYKIEQIDADGVQINGQRYPLRESVARIPAQAGSEKATGGMSPIAAGTATISVPVDLARPPARADIPTTAIR